MDLEMEGVSENLDWSHRKRLSDQTTMQGRCYGPHKMEKVN